MGEGARKAKYKVLGHVVKKKFSFDTYLIKSNVFFTFK